MQPLLRNTENWGVLSGRCSEELTQVTASAFAAFQSAKHREESARNGSDRQLSAFLLLLSPAHHKPSQSSLISELLISTNSMFKHCTF